MAISLVVHVVVLMAIGLIVPKTHYRFEPQDTAVKLLLLPPMPRETIRLPRPQTASSARTPASRPQPPAPRIHTPATPPKNAPPSPIVAPAAPPSTQAARPGTSYAPGPLPADDTPHGVQALLRRSVGCDYAETVHLTAEEKEACLKRFGDMARRAAPLSGVPDDKRGLYSVQAAADARKRGAREGPMAAPVVACSGNGSNFGVGCLPDSAMGHTGLH